MQLLSARPFLHRGCGELLVACAERQPTGVALGGLVLSWNACAEFGAYLPMNVSDFQPPPDSHAKAMRALPYETRIQVTGCSLTWPLASSDYGESHI